MAKKVKVKKPKNANLVMVAGVGVNIGSEEVASAKSIEDLQKLDIFSHLKEKDQTVAYTELLAKIPVQQEEEV